MASNLDYLNPDLLPLEQTVTAYLEAEEELRKANVEVLTRQAQPQDQAIAESGIQRPASGSFDQTADELRTTVQNLQQTIARLREEILRQLPTRDEWVKVNLGYGPSRVGAFRDETAPGEQYIIRVVH